MPWIEFKMISGQEYAYIRHQVRLGDRYKAVHIAYLGPVHELTSIGSRRYNADVSALYRARTQGVTLPDRNECIRAILAAYNVRFDRRAARDRARRLMR